MNHRLSMTLLGLGLAAAIVPHAVAPKALSSAPVSSGRISAISDGDTVRVTSSDGTDLGRIRLLGINAPELGHDGQSGQCWAAQARDTLSRIVPVGSTVQLVADPTQADRDVYGRPLRYLVQDGLDVQEALLRQGAAHPFWPAGAGTRAPLYDLALTDAQQAQRGLWSACPKGVTVNMDPDATAQPDAEYELVQAQDTHAQALARMDRARREQEATDAAGYDQPGEDSTRTR